jgi:PhzF family phenazine biosynthesis protein
MGQPIVQVDAFTDTLFSGNPAVVCILDQPAPDHWMQQVAREMNLSETAFLYRHNDGFNLRWFTPALEVDLCGHATLASAHVLWEAGRLEPNQAARFHTRSGLLTATCQEGWIELNFPAQPPEPITPPDELALALGVVPRSVGTTPRDYIVEVDGEDAVRALQPDLAMLARLPLLGTVVTSLSGSPEYDFVSRMFAPRAGIPEDPVTGSSHCALGPFWASRLHKDRLVAFQASARGGLLRVRVSDERVYLQGQAVTVLRGELVKTERTEDGRE